MCRTEIYNGFSSGFWLDFRNQRHLSGGCLGLVRHTHTHRRDIPSDTYASCLVRTTNRTLIIENVTFWSLSMRAIFLPWHSISILRVRSNFRTCGADDRSLRKRKFVHTHPALPRSRGHDTCNCVTGKKCLLQLLDNVFAPLGVPVSRIRSAVTALGVW